MIEIFGCKENVDVEVKKDGIAADSVVVVVLAYVLYVLPFSLVPF